MGRKVLLDGKIEFIDCVNLRLDSPALNYGTGLFETILYEKERIFFLSEHLQRLTNSCRSLNIPLYESKNTDEKLLYSLIKSNGMENNSCRIKILYSPLFSISKWNLAVSVSEYTRNNEPVEVVVCTNSRENDFYKFKTTSYMQNFIMQSSQQDQETLFINSRGNIIEGTKTNILCVKDKALYYVDLNENYLNGIMQQHLVEDYKSFGFKSSVPVKYGFTMDFIKECDCVFLSNSLMIAKSVSRLRFGENTFDVQTSAIPDDIRNRFLSIK